jgi:hypothetical protein
MSSIAGARGPAMRSSSSPDPNRRHGILTMSHVAFGAPNVGRFHLHERLARELLGRGHRASAVFLDAGAFAFWGHQGLECAFVGAGAADAMRAPIAEFAARECSRRGLPLAGPTARCVRARLERRLAGLVPGVLRWLERVQPDLLLLHEDRGADQALLQFIAVECGVRVLWTGNGLLPHTLQVDAVGLDGDAAACRRHAIDYRTAPRDPDLLQAALANLLAQTLPAALSQREIHVPPLAARVRAAARHIVDHDAHGALDALFGWRRAAAAPEPPPSWLFDPPLGPFVAVLLQDRDDTRLRLDAASPPAPHELAAAARDAAAQIDPAIALVVVMPPRGLHHRELAAVLRIDGVQILHAEAAPAAAAAAMAAFTVNHPLATAALLAGTPVVHTGRALFGLPGVTAPTPTADLAAGLRRALAAEQPTLRERFLTWLLGHEHIWCSSTMPDHNGILGLAREIEDRLGERGQSAAAPRYRSGPAWPLETDGRGR